MAHEMRSKNWTIACLVAVAVVAASGCGPRKSPALDRAEYAYGQAAKDPRVTTNAQVPLHEAKQSLDGARHALARGDDTSVVDHDAYIAEQKVAIAVATAEREEAKKSAQALNDHREDVIIGARTREAEQRTREAEQARMEADQARAHAQQLEVELENAKRTDRGLVLTLGDVLFATGQADLKPGAMKNLYNLVTFLRDHPDRNVVIEGHTDNVGPDAYNQQLSQQRAEAVRSFLASNGVSSGRIRARGLGEALPVAPNETEAGRQQNRRVEVVVLDVGQVDADAAVPAPAATGEYQITIPIR